MITANPRGPYSGQMDLRSVEQIAGLRPRLGCRYLLRLADFFPAFLLDRAAFLVGDFFLPPKMASQPSANFLVVPTRMMLMGILQRLQFRSGMPGSPTAYRVTLVPTLPHPHNNR